MALRARLDRTSAVKLTILISFLLTEDQEVLRQEHPSSRIAHILKLSASLTLQKQHCRPLSYFNNCAMGPDVFKAHNLVDSFDVAANFPTGAGVLSMYGIYSNPFVLFLYYMDWISV